MKTQVTLGIPFAVGLPDELARKLLDALAAMGLGATDGPQGAGNILFLVAQQVALDVPDNIIQELQAVINGATQPNTGLGAANPIPWPVTTAPPSITISNDGAYIFVGSEPAMANMCLSWTQERLALPHEYPTAIDAWNGYLARGLATTTPEANDMVFFAAAPINGGDGHVGIVQADGTFDSVWSNGNVMDAPIGRFANDNGASVLGYISTAKLRAALGL